MTDNQEAIAPGVTRRVAASSAAKFAPFLSINGATTSVVAGFSRDEKIYTSVPMASIMLKSDNVDNPPAFTVAIDDIVFLNLVLSSSLKEIVLAYKDGAVSNIQEPDETAKMLRVITEHWSDLTLGLREFADLISPPSDNAK